nr:PKD domain-containing protein [uncultured Methanospirillum sp.]
MNLRIFALVLLVCCCFSVVIPAYALSPQLIASDLVTQVIPDIPGFSLSSVRSDVILKGIVGGTVVGLTSVSENNTTVAGVASENTTVDSVLFTASDTSLISRQSINGKLVDQRIIGPGLPPKGWVSSLNLASATNVSVQGLSSSDVPAMRWSYGCSATSATMLFGYYDRAGYANMYTGPTNGGVFPLTNSVWGSSSEGNGQCPLSASQNGLDGRTTRGHKDDYYYAYGSSTDPYYDSWTEHTPLDCIGDYMGTNMYKKYGNSDGSTTFWYYSDGSPTYDFTYYDSTSRDGMHGMRLFAESRGYGVATNYNQYIDSAGLTYGFTYAQYKAEIDAGYPVLIQVNGHTMLGIGYSGTNQVIVHDTWDYSDHTMTWGGYYSGMKHYGVGVIHLNPPPVVLAAKFYGVPGVSVLPLTIQFHDASTGSPTSWFWNFGDGTNSSVQNPSHQYNNSGTYTVNLTVSS